MGGHIIDGEFQSDKYPTTPRGKVPLSVKDPTAQDLLWEYAQRRRSVDAEFSDDLEAALRTAGYSALSGWRTGPPTLDEVRAGSWWWWYRQRGEDEYTEPHVLEIGIDDDGLFFVEPGCPRVTPEEYGEDAEWHPLFPPRTP